MQKLRIFLGDITHDTIVLVSDTIPINIGFIASYIKKIYGDRVDITLFKYADDIIKEIKSNPPDVIGLSNYSWNSNLSEFLISLAKKHNPNIVTVQGGTNFPHDEETQKEFLSERPATDIFTILEGEKSFDNIIGRVLECIKIEIKFLKKKLMDVFLFIQILKISIKKFFIKGKS